MITTFLAASTKNNFKFYCDKCLTNLEISMAESETNKLNNLEKKYIGMEKKLEEIKELLLVKGDEAVIPKIVMDKPVTNIWDDKEKLEAVKAPLPKSVLVIKRAEEEERNVQNHNFIENTLMNHNIPVTKSFKSKSGHLLVVCESKDARDQINDLVSTTKSGYQICYSTRDAFINHYCGFIQRVQQG